MSEIHVNDAVVCHGLSDVAMRVVAVTDEVIITGNQTPYQSFYHREVIKIGIYRPIGWFGRWKLIRDCDKMYENLDSCSQIEVVYQGMPEGTIDCGKCEEIRKIYEREFEGFSLTKGNDK